MYEDLERRSLKNKSLELTLGLFDVKVFQGLLGTYIVRLSYYVGSGGLVMFVIRGTDPTTFYGLDVETESGDRLEIWVYRLMDSLST